MVELRIKNTSVCLSFTFFASAALFLLTNGSFGMAALCACGLHELSHLILMILFRVSADQIMFYGAGICISSQEINRTGKVRRVLILIAGCMGNLIAAAVMFLIGNNVASAINLFTAFFNMLPIGALDGAQLLKIIAVRCCKPENVDKITRICELISVILLSAVIILFSGFSFSISVIILYIVLVCCIQA